MSGTVFVVVSEENCTHVMTVLPPLSAQSGRDTGDIIFLIRIYGPEFSEFADFFATYKATLPVIGRLSRISGARIIPLFPVYDGKTHHLTIHVSPPLAIRQKSDAHIARQINEVVENFVRPHPEQYTWILKLLKTRKEGEEDPY